MAKIYDAEVLSINATTAVGLTASKYDNNGATRASKVTIQIGTTAVFFNFEPSTGNTPSASTGFSVGVGDIVEVTDFDNLRDLKIISQLGSGTVYVAYES